MSTELGVPEADAASRLAEGLEGARRAPPVALVIFGASGDLTSRKILPALARLSGRRALGSTFAVVGVARSDLSDDDFRKLALDSVPGAGPEWKAAVARFRYVAGDYAHPDTFDELKEVLADLDEHVGTAGNRIYYLATIPAVFSEVAGALGEHGLSQPARPESFVRLVVEKPYGRDLASATKLDDAIHESFDENQVYRIDHYMGKETVQNVLALRFANAIYEPIWNRRYVDHLQITVAESLGVGHRGGFYETAGALRDIVQNHVMQVLALTLMEPPVWIDGQSIRDEKVKALRSVEIPTPEMIGTDVVRAQYEEGWVEGEQVVGYRQEEGVDTASATETYVAMRLNVDNWRWAGVPVYVRTGKRLPKRVTEVAMQFHRVPHLSFQGSLSEGLESNALVMRIQPDEGITLRFGAMVPGQTFRVRTVSMDFAYGAAFMEQTPEAYERLLLDAMVGDPTLFIRTDEVDQAWQIVDPVLESWARGQPPVSAYEAGSWGPKEADLLLERDGRRWRTP